MNHIRFYKLLNALLFCREKFGQAAFVVSSAWPVNEEK